MVVAVVGVVAGSGCDNGTVAGSDGGCIWKYIRIAVRCP